MKYLIDTDWVIDHLSGIEKIKKKLEELAPEGLALSIVSLAELYEGVFYSRNPEKSEKTLKEFLPGISILGIDEETCRIFGKERGRLRKKGKIIGDFDLLIASTCLHYNLMLLTNNIDHFKRVENLKIISV
ncbi:type II toxin-antitoxin system VapC family toxin [Candidatus Aerophobetes bacterium]|nr:type II toxin-antitoxin system VapC family toxin [Candidatus Aerophobetes bacterium]